MKDYIILGAVLVFVCSCLIIITYVKNKWNLKTKIFAILLPPVCIIVLIGFAIGDIGLSVKTILISAPIGIVVSSSTVILLNNMIVKPVKSVLDVMAYVANGDLAHNSDYISKDELGDLSNNVNIAVNNLKDMFRVMKKGMQDLSRNLTQISNGNQELSQRTIEQAASLEEIASTLEQSTGTIKQNAENSEEANRLSNDTIKTAEDGGKVVDEAVNAINVINQSSKKIGEIINVINEISFQTNLLALNASVEAARAGEHGKGFAVVAGEVKNLAERAAVSSREIGALIQESIEKIDVGTERVNKSGEALNQIIDATKKVGKIINEIAHTSEEQKQGIEQINFSITELDTMTQQNSALVEETASTSVEIANQSQNIVDMMEQFRV